MSNYVDNLSLLLQLYNLVLLMQDFNNSDLMKELKTIINQNEEILELLKKGEKSYGTTNN